MRTNFVATIRIVIVQLALVGTGALAHPGSGIVVDKQGQIFFTDTGHGVWKIDSKGKLTDLPASRFHWMAIDEVGHFAESQKGFGEWFERVTPQSSKPVLMICSDFPLTAHPDGNLYYADTRRSSAHIVRRTSDGRESVLASGEKNKAGEKIDPPIFKGITGIAVGPDGSLYVTDVRPPEAVAIRKISMDGTVSTVTSDFIGKDPVGNDPGKDPPADTAATYCRGLAVDADGVVYVAATGSRRVLKITPQGQVSTIMEAPSPWSPTGVVLFGGEVYVLEWSEPAASRMEDRSAWIPRVRKVARDGTIATLATVSR